MRAVEANDTLSIILKLVGEVCNLDCTYCYEKRKPYEGNRILQPETVSSVLKRFGKRPLRIELHGGEPLLYPMKKMDELVQMFDSHGPQVRVAIQTNGVLMTQEWLDTFAPLGESFEIGLSMDGPEDLNDWRLDHRGGSSASSVTDCLTLLESKGIRTGVISVVTNRLIGRSRDIIDFFAGFSNVSLLKFVPCFDFNVSQSLGPVRSQHTRSVFEHEGAVRQRWSISPAEYTNFLKSAFDYWAESGLARRLILEPFLGVTQSALGTGTNSCIFSDTKCQHVMTLYPDGSIGSCDEFNRTDVSYGHHEELGSGVNNPSKYFATCSATDAVEGLEKKCSHCSYYSVCKGGCIASRMRLASVGRDEEYCDYRRNIIDHLQERFMKVIE